MMTESRVVITGKQIGLTDNRSKTKSIEEKMNTLSESCILFVNLNQTSTKPG